MGFVGDIGVPVATIQAAKSSGGCWRGFPRTTVTDTLSTMYISMVRLFLCFYSHGPPAQLGNIHPTLHPFCLWGYVVID